MDINKINEKIDAALLSLEGIKRAEADDALFDGILQRLEKKTVVAVLVPMRMVWLAAASFALILLLNVASFVAKSNGVSQKRGNNEGVHSEAAMAIADIYLSPKS
jgi:hypothetical protein